MNQHYASTRESNIFPTRLLLVLALIVGCLPVMKAQTNYVFYNGTYGYLYNDGGTLKASTSLRFDRSSVWIASGTIGGNSRTIQSYTDNKYLGNAGSLTTTSSNWRGSNNYLCYRTGGTNYYLKATSATTFTTNSNQNNGERFNYYTVTISGAPDPVLTDFTINSGNATITATGNYTYGHSNANYTPAYTNYYFSNANHYVGSDNNTLNNVNPTAVTTGYTWSLSANASGYASMSGNSLQVTALPEYDITITLTSTLTYDGITKTATKDITLQGTYPSAPTINVSGTSVTLSTTAAGTTTIRYTLDGTDPTASTGTVYSGAIDLSSSTSSPVTIKAVTVRNGNASNVAQQSVTLTLPAPVITVNASAGTATISATSGATIYYTTNGSDPTTSSSTYSGSLSGLSLMTTIKAIAVKDGWNNSPVASATLTIPSGVSGGVVTLFDYEPHSWSYYSDPDCPIRSLNPADVKITYYGDGIVMTGDADYTAGMAASNYVTPGQTNYTGGAKVNVGGEDENTFIYYKTLERGDATQTAWTYSSSSQSSAASRCPYTPIPNPFQVRPTYGSRGSTDANDFTGWRGFQCWRLKSVTGGAVYSAASGGTALTTGAIINAGTEIYFAPNSEYGMEVQLEAVWARAYLIKGNQSGENAILSQNVGVERNFMTLTANENYRFNGTSGRCITNIGYPVTISCYYPSGEAPDNTNGVVVGNNNNITLGANTKFENVTLSAAAYTLTTSGYDVIIGRGCTSTNIGTVRGMSSGSTSAVNYTIRLESGTYGTFALIDNTARTFSSTVSTRAVFGSDYDRAKSDNEKLSIAANSTVYGGNAVHVFSSASNRNNLTYDWLIKSGRVQGSKSVTDANADESIYIGNSGNNDNTQYMGKRRFIMEGGEVASIAGSLNSYGNNYSTYAVNDGIAVEIRIKGGLVRGSIYGAAAYASAAGDRKFILTGGEVRGWVAGGANGTQTDGGYLYGQTNLYVGGNAKVDSKGSTSVINRAVGGNVFGAGCGYGANSNSGQVTEGTTVVVADEAYVERGVYGGGSYGYTTSTSTLYVSGGHVEGKNGGVSGTSYSASITGGVFGGACQNQGGTVNITMTDGLVEGGVYGGSNATGTISNNVTMQINGGQVGTSSKNANIHGGGYGSATRVSQNVEITLGTTTQTTPGVTVYGDVYGGSALGYVNGTTATTTYHTYVTLNKGTINGSLYGGGLGEGTTAANVYGPVQVKVYGGSVRKTDTDGSNGSGGVYGANNVNGAPQRSVTVDIYGTDPAPSANEYALFAVYGGGNQADYTYGNGYPKVTVHNCDNSIEYVYGGGNAAEVAATDVKIYGGNTIGTVFGGGNGTVTAANVTGNASTNIYGGTIGRVFGGSNSQGTIGGSITVNAQSQAEGSETPCQLHVGALYGGGNKAASNVGNITVGCMAATDMIDTVYCGANQANITGSVNFTMEGGRIGTLFGGNNKTGNISGTITLGVNWATGTGACPDGTNYLGNVFGGGNLATYGSANSNYPVVNILNGTVSGNVYGGGKGLASDHTKGQVTGNPVVTIGDNVNGHTAVVTGDVYGGGDAGNVVGTPQVNVVNKCNTSIGNVYGGGNAADVNGTDVNIDGGNITGMVFGGGHGNNDPNDLKVANVNGNVDVDITGGTINKVFAGSNLNGTISGSVTLDINKASGACDMKIGEVYGGGNEAAGNAGTITVGCTGALTTQASNPAQIGTTLEGIGAVYGGANKADIGTSSANSNITLNINSGMVGNVYGGNNTSGDIYGTIQVNINKTSDACGWYVGDVFGGGNLADYGGTPDVNIQAGTVSGSVFGGGNAADVAGSDVAVTGGQINGGVYGGCNASGNTGPVVVSLTGGQVGTSSTRADVFGGGFGKDTETSSDIKVTLNGTTVYGDLYGGSAFGGVNSNATEDTTLVTLKTATLYGSIFGGGKGQAVVGDSITAISNGMAIVNIDVYDPHLTGIYGGAYINGNVIGDITVNVNDTVGQDADHTLNVFGGGFGQATTTEGNVTVNFGTEDGSKKPLIYGNLYGGSSQGQVNATGKTTTVYVYNGTVNGDVYGGGLGVKNASGNYNQGTYHVANDSIHAVVNGDALVYIGTDAQTSGNDVVITGNVFGGSDRCGNTLGNITVHIFHTAHTTANTAPDQSVPDVATINDLTEPAASAFALKGVYGGGNLAHYESTGANSTKKASVYVHGCDNSIQYLYGGGNAANTTANYIEIEGGRFYKIFGGGNGEVDSLPGANVTNGDATTIVNGGVFNYIFGGSNTKGDIAGNMNLDIEPIGNTGCGRMIVGNLFGGGNVAPCNGGELTVKCGDLVVGDVYGGANMADVYGDVVLNIEGGNLNNVFGGSRGVAATNGNSGVAANILGSVTLNLKGGTMKAAFGGSDQNGNITGQITVNVIDAENNTCPLVVDTIYGAGNVTPYTPDSINDVKIVSPIVNLQHMKRGNAVSYDVFGGGLGSTAKVTANPMVIIGNTVDTAYAKVGRNVYGGGSKAPVDGGTKVVVRGYAPANDTIMGSVFGGGSQAGVSDTTVVQILNGTVLTGVYGGCNTSGSVGGTANVVLTGGLIGSTGQRANVYGGGLGPDTRMNGDVLVTIGATDGNTTPTYSGSAVITGDVYGGSAKGITNCNDAGTAHQGSSKTDVTLYGGTINGDLYGGGHGIDGAAANVFGPVQVTVNKGTVTGSVYGCNNAAGAPQSTVNVDIYGTDTPASGYALGNVFGGGNQAAYPNIPVVKVHNCDNSIEYVYGGGNAATVAATDVTIYGGHTINNVFGGCYGANVTTSGTNVKIYGGTINHVYGGNNLSGNITGSINVTVEKTQESGHPSCEMHIGEVYGGGNKADSNAGNITINCTGNGATEGIEYVYGGANQADVTGPIVLNITEGRIANVFGGNNTSGTITGSITVNINKKASPCVWDITNVYGGGNQAVYGTAGDNLPIVNILNGLVSGDVFGGGLGLEGDPTKGVVTGNPQVIVNGAGAQVSGGVYGGGSLAPTKGNPVVTLTTGALTKVFGGGKAANINGAPTVNINGGTVSTGVYGGCDSIGEVSGNITVNVNNGTIGASNARANIHGGGYGQNTSTKGNVTVNFGITGTDHNEYPKLYGDVYGGSALGEVNANSANNTTVNILNGVLYTDQTTSSNGFPVYNGGNVFGGGLGRKAGGGNTAAEAKVNGIVIVNIGGPNGSKALNPDDDDNVGYAIIGGNVYGCNNTNGSPQDSVTVNVYRTHRTNEQQINYTGENPSYAIANVFGGGNEADYVPSDTATHKKLKVYIHDCYNSVKRVFGGSNAAAAGAANTNSVTVHTIIEGGRFDNVFGGGNGEVQAANINGNVNLEIHGGIVNEFFVGSNQSGTISGTSKVTVDETSNCESVLITEFFCGGKYADVEGNIEASIDCSEALTVHSLYGGCKEADVHGNVHLSVYGGYYTNVFGGSKGVLPPDNPTQAQLDAASADITGSVTLDLYGGTMENVFGGSNVNGNINGTITVNVIDAESQTCPLYITNIYGGSNLTSYTPSSASAISPVVNVVHIKSGISGNVYGASKGVVGTAATVTANPQVNIGYDATQMSSYLSSVHYTVPAAPRAIISGSVFGGGDAATVIGNTEIFLRKKAKVFGNVYGGGNMGEVTGNTKVIVNGQNN